MVHRGRPRNFRYNAPELPGAFRRKTRQVFKSHLERRTHAAFQAVSNTGLAFGPIVLPRHDLNVKTADFLLDYPELVNSINSIKRIENRPPRDHSPIRCQEKIHGPSIQLLERSEERRVGK